MSLIYDDLSKVNLRLPFVKPDFLCYSRSLIRVLCLRVVFDPFFAVKQSNIPKCYNFYASNRT